MRTLWILAVLLVGVEGSVFELEKMILQVRGKEAVQKYGLYRWSCGVGRRGNPQDATDRCCYMHKWCYKKLTDCDPKTDRYSYDLKKGEILCEMDNACIKDTCECDKALAICLRDNLNTYNKKYLGPPRFSPRESVEEAPVGSFSRNMLLRRLRESARKQYKESRNLSQCFWKYCV